jgi:hypothetical protein
MKKLIARTVLALAVCVMTDTVTWANVINKHVTFSTDVMVNGTLFKKGNYKLKFDDQTGELTFLNGKTPVKVMAHWEHLDKKARQTTIISIRHSNSEALQRIIFGGEDKALTLGEGKSAVDAVGNKVIDPDGGF